VTGRLGPWQPLGDAERLDRLDSLASIKQLPPRYALALDSRDMDTLVELFVPDVKAGPGAVGRDALKAYFIEIMRLPRASVHFVGNHVIDFDSADQARGVVYCRDQLERPLSGRWDVGEIQYWDRYRRIDGTWFFEGRKFNRWYISDWLTRPKVGAGVNDGTDPLPGGQLPEVYRTWREFWADTSGA
jgi:hypothetical protein